MFGKTLSLSKTCFKNRSSSVSSADGKGLVKRMSTSVTNLTGKLARSKTVHGLHGRPRKTKKSQTDQDIDAMDEVLAAIGK